MIADAYDTVVILGWALAVWIAALAVVAGVIAYTVTAAVAWLCGAARRAMAGALAAEQALRALPEHQTALTAAYARLQPGPSWAQPEQDAA